MHLFTVPLVVASAVLFFADTPQVRQVRIKKDVEALQGVWAIVRVEAGGEDRTKDLLDVKDFKLRITGDKVVPVRDGKEQAGESMTFAIDPSAKPKSIDLISMEKKTSKAIYSLDGGQLKVAFYFVIFGREPEERPTSFDTKTHEKLLCVFLKKAEK